MIDPLVIPATLAITLLTEVVSIVSKRMRTVSSVLARSAQSVRATCSFLEASVLHVIWLLAVCQVQTSVTIKGVVLSAKLITTLTRASANFAVHR